MTDPGWGIHNFELALRRWWRDYSPDPDLVEKLKAWRNEVESQGIREMEQWIVINDADEFVGELPGTPIIVSGVLIFYEELVIVQKFVGA